MATAGTSRDGISPQNGGNLASELCCEKGDPNEYSILCLDKSLVPNCIMNQYEDREIPKGLENIYYSIAPQKFRCKKEADTGRSPAVEATFREVSYHKNENGVAWKRNYIAVRSWQRLCVHPLEIFASKLFGTEDRQEPTEPKCSSLMLIILRPDVDIDNPSRQLVYVFGKWMKLVNKHAIVQEWGLKLALTEEICGKDKILCKQIEVETVNEYNPKIKTTKVLTLDSPKIFGLNIGSEFINSIRLLPIAPNNKVRSRVVTGKNHFHAKFRVCTKADGECNTMDTFIRASDYYYRASRNNIHPKFRDLVDFAIEDASLNTSLNNELENIFKEGIDNCTKYFINLSSKVFHWMGRTLTFSVDGEHYGSFFSAFEELITKKCVKLESIVSVQNEERSEHSDEPLGRMIRALAIELEDYPGNFYRYDCGRWFAIPDNTFDFITGKLNDLELNYEEIGLIPYTKSHDSAKNDYKESAYNKGVVRKLCKRSNKISQISAVLIDRLTINYPPHCGKDCFEFGDILVIKGNENYIIHVKRSSSSSLVSHHCDQIVRCVEYLSNVRTKDRGGNMLIQACINSLYLEQNIEIPSLKKKSKGPKIVTHGQTITIPSNDKWQSHLTKKLTDATKNPTTDFTKNIRQEIKTFFATYNFFNECQTECVASLNALFDCDQRSERPLSWKTVEKFFRTMREYINLRSKLFSNGIISQATRKNTYIVMAIIDDKGTYSGFRKQQLPGLNHTATIVEKAEFLFRWTVIKNKFDVDSTSEDEDDDVDARSNSTDKMETDHDGSEMMDVETN